MKRINMKSMVEVEVRKGRSTRDILADNPNFNPNSLKVIVSRTRKALGITTGATKQGPPIQLPLHLHDALGVEALDRFGVKSTSHDMAIMLIAIIVKDDLFNDILGDA